MIKSEFLITLEKRLSHLPKVDVDKTLEYYSEMIDDLVDELEDEEKAVESLGSVDNIAKEITADIPMTKLIKEKVKPKHKLSWWEITLLVVGSPLWLSLLISLFAVVLSLYICIWAVVISLYAVVVALFGAFLGLIVFGIFFATTRGFVRGLLLFGVGLFCGGLAIVMTYVSNFILKQVLKLSRVIWRFIKSLFVTKEKKNEEK